MSKQIKLVLKNKKDELLEIKQIFAKLRENFYQGSLDYNVEEVLLEDDRKEREEPKTTSPSKTTKPKKGSSDPKQSDKLATKRVDADEDLKARPGMKELIELGFIPVIAHKPADFDHVDKADRPARNSAELGRGMQGAVYEVARGGKRYAAKVSSTNALGSNQEFMVRTKIEQIRASIPKQFSKHIVKTIYIGKTKDSKFNIYIMEPLRMMNDFESSILYDEDPEDLYPKTSVLSFFKDPKNIYDTIKTQFIPLLKNKIDEGERMRDLILASSKIRHLFFDLLIASMRDVFPRINLAGIEKPSENSSSLHKITDHVSKQFASYFADKIYNSKEFQELPEINKEPEAEDTIFYFFKYTFAILFNTNIRVKGFHKHNDSFTADDKQIQKMSQEQKKFTRALVYLAKEFDIKWHDLHGGNVLMRGSEYVATDIGLFNLPLSKTPGDLPHNVGNQDQKKTRQLPRNNTVVDTSTKPEDSTGANDLPDTRKEKK